MILHFLVLGYLCHFGSTVEEDPTSKSLTLAYSIPWTGVIDLGGSFASAINIGLKEVHRRQLLPGYKIHWVMRDSSCSTHKGMKVLVEMWNSVHLDGLIGDVCSVVCQPQALLAAAWNIPVVAIWCSSPALSDKSMYPTFTHMVGAYTNLGPMINALLDTFGWQNVAIMYTSEEIWSLTAIALRNEFVKQNKTVFMRLIKKTVTGTTNDATSIKSLQSSLNGLKNVARIIILACYKLDQENILYTSLEEGMINGEYVFLVIGQAGIILKDHYPYKTEADRHICEGLLGTDESLPSGSKFDTYLEEVIKELQNPVFANLSHLPPTAPKEHVHIAAGMLPLYT